MMAELPLVAMSAALSAAVAAVASGAIGLRVGLRRASHAENLRAAAQRASDEARLLVDRERGRIAPYLRELERDAVLLRRISVGLPLVERQDGDRPGGAPRDLARLLDLLVGLAHVDASVIASRDGLVRAGAPLAPFELAALAVPVGRALDACERVVGAALAASVEVGPASSVVARVLPEWTGRSLLLAYGASVTPNPLALSAVGAAAERAGRGDTEAVPPPSLVHTGGFGARGPGGALFVQELEQLAVRVGASTAALVSTGKLRLGHIDRGPSPDELGPLAASLHRATEHLAHLVREPVRRFDVSLEGGGAITLATLTDSSSEILLITRRKPVEERELRAFAGRLRRLATSWPNEATS
jgi:hypothetical protein